MYGDRMAPTQLGAVVALERPLTDHDHDHGPPEPIGPGPVLDLLIRNLRSRSGARRGLANELVAYLATRTRDGRYSKQSLHNKRAGHTAMTPDEIRWCAEYLGVPVEVFFLPTAAEVLRWIADHRADDIPTGPSAGR